MPKGERYLFAVNRIGNEEIVILRISKDTGKTYISKRGNIYLKEEMEKNGYVFVEAVPATLEFMRSIQYFLDHHGSYNGSHEAARHTGVLSKMLQKLDEEADQ